MSVAKYASLLGIHAEETSLWSAGGPSWAHHMGIYRRRSMCLKPHIEINARDKARLGDGMIVVDRLPA
jgi:hypothetical protein